MSLLDYLFGPRYWANIVRTRGTDRVEICSYIFRTRADARAHQTTLESLRSYDYLATISFRTRAPL